MNDSASFALNRPSYLVKILKPEDAVVLQTLYEQCTEFALLTDGQPPSPTARQHVTNLMLYQMEKQRTTNIFLDYLTHTMI